MEYRILIVDEDAATRRMYAEWLVANPPATGVAYRITTIGSPTAARLQATRQRYNLLITTLRPAGLGLDLAGKLRTLYPDIQQLLLCDRTTNSVQVDIAQRLNACIADLPINNEQLVARVGEILGLRKPSLDTASFDAKRPLATLADVQLLLDVLRHQTQAQIALYIDNIGHIIAQRGDATGLEVTSLTSLIAGGFVNSLEMGQVLRDTNTNHLSVHEGLYHDVYVTNVSNSRLLALVFDKEFVQPKLGFVWLLLKRSAEQLCQMRIAEGSIDDILSQQLMTSLNLEFDRLFGSELLDAELVGFKRQEELYGEPADRPFGRTTE